MTLESQKSQTGFTLLELMVVMSIIVVLTMVGVFSFDVSKAKLDKMAVQAELMRLWRSYKQEIVINKAVTPQWVQDNFPASGISWSGKNFSARKKFPADNANFTYTISLDSSVNSIVSNQTAIIATPNYAIQGYEDTLYMYAGGNACWQSDNNRWYIPNFQTCEAYVNNVGWREQSWFN